MTRRTRRQVLRYGSLLGVSSVAGCGTGTPDTEADPATRTPAADPTATETPSTTSTDAPTETAGPGPIEGSWPAFQRDAGNTSADPTATGPRTDPEVLWETRLSSETFARRPTQVLVDGTLYVSDYPGELLALDAASGEELWRYATDQPISSTPVVRGDALYLATDDGTVRAIDRTDGATAWTAEPTGTGDGGYLAASDDHVYGFSPGAEVYALDRGNGQKIWGYGRSPTGFAVGEDAVFVTSTLDDVLVVALDPLRGSGNWTWSARGIPRAANPTLWDGTVHVGVARTPEGGANVHALDAAGGTRKWRTRVGEEDTSLGVEEVAVRGGTLYAVASPTEDPGSVFLYAVNRGTGSVEWQFRTGDNFAVAAASETVYAGGRDRRVYAIDTTDGTLRWSHHLGEYVRSILVADRTVFVGTRNGGLYAIYEPN